MKMSFRAVGVIACVAVWFGMPLAVQAVTGNFSVSIDGATAVNQAEDFKTANVESIEFNHLDSDFSVSYLHSVFYSDDDSSNYVTLATNIPENVVNFADYYRGEGIYRVSMQGLDQFSSPDSGYFNNLVQSTKSVVAVDDVVNDPATVVANPLTVVVGRDVTDVYGDFSYYWEILDSNNVVVLSGTDVQPDQADIDALPDGTYLVRNTVTEPIALEFGGGSVSDTTAGAFVLVSNSDSVTPVVPAETEITGDGSVVNGDILPETGSATAELAIFGSVLFAGALMVLKKVFK